MSAKKTEKTGGVPFEEAMARLEEIVSDLEGGELSLEKSLSSFEEGMKLAKICEDCLGEASGRVEKIMRDFAGTAKRVPLGVEEMNDAPQGAGGDDDGF